MIAKINNILKNPLALIFLLLVTTEFTYKLLIREFAFDFKISAGFKILLQAFFFLQIVRVDYKKLWPLVMLLAVFLIGQVCNVDAITLQKNLWFFDKYIFILLTLVYVNTLQDRTKYFSFLAICFEAFILLNSLAILLGFFFEIALFETYRSSRFGYNGLILRSGAASYIYIIALFYAFHQVMVLKKQKWTLLVLTVLSSFLLGTKAIIIGWGFLIFYLIWKLGWLKKTYIKMVLGLFTVLAIIFWKPLLEIAFSFSGTFQKVYENNGIFTAIFSLRDLHLKEEMIPLMQGQWSWVNYLFGGGFNMHWRSQFGVLDLFYFFGIFGMIFYLFTFWNFFVTFKRNFFVNTVLICLFVLMALSAHFFYETILAFHLVFLKGYFEEIQT